MVEIGIGMERGAREGQREARGDDREGGAVDLCVGAQTEDVLDGLAHHGDGEDDEQAADGGPGGEGGDLGDEGDDGHDQKVHRGELLELLEQHLRQVAERAVLGRRDLVAGKLVALRVRLRLVDLDAGVRLSPA